MPGVGTSSLSCSGGSVRPICGLGGQEVPLAQEVDSCSPEDAAFDQVEPIVLPHQRVRLPSGGTGADAVDGNRAAAPRMLDAQSWDCHEAGDLD